MEPEPAPAPLPEVVLPPHPAGGDRSASTAVAAPASTPAETDSNPEPSRYHRRRRPAERRGAEHPAAARAAGADGTVQLPPEILVDRHLLRAEGLLSAADPAAALEEMTEILALQQEHDLVSEDGFAFEYAHVAYAAGRTETAIASANRYLAAAGRRDEFYREALELLDSAELRLEREEAERRRARRRSRAPCPPPAPRAHPGGQRPRAWSGTRGPAWRAGAPH